MLEATTLLCKYGYTESGAKEMITAQANLLVKIHELNNSIISLEEAIDRECRAICVRLTPVTSSTLG